MNRRELEEAQAWGKKQVETVAFKIPDREPGEEPITEKQFGYIKHLLAQVDDSELRKLGKWQASSIIDQIKVEKVQFTAQKVEEYRNKRKGKFGCLEVLLVVIALIILCLIVELYLS